MRFLHFFQSLIFVVNRQVNGNMTQNDKKLFPSHSVSISGSIHQYDHEFWYANVK